ncbi:MAG TPA: DUF3427 domain-containing protein [Acidimicrobiales bacterium]|nr:DUF3427 domain-containing protein [Acidimicrobiales bacterium]
MDLVPGLYETLITEQLREVLDALIATGHVSDERNLDDAEVSEVLAYHVGATVEQLLQALPAARRLQAANDLLSVARAHEPQAKQLVDLVTDGPKQLWELRRSAANVVPLRRPRIPLRDADLLVNARGEPGLAAELAAEIESADQINLLCAFIKWHGIRLIWDQLEAFVHSGRQLRVLTTTYVGATEARAVEALARLGAEIRVSYETRSTRLHAKAWLFRRNTGWDTAYVGSSNLSRSALVDGLEWNVRLSRQATSALIEKFGATFDAYWVEPHFEHFDPDRDGERLRAALGSARTPQPSFLSGLEVRAFPYQETILDDLDRERHRHDRWRNLVVAATGTGKTVIAAFDYRRLREELGGDPSLLFVAHRKEILQQSIRTFREVLSDGSFGELYVDGERPERWRHVFASVQSLHRLGATSIDTQHFAVVIVDEFHHAEAATYRALLHHLEPKVLLGLTATPFRADGQDVTQWFDGHIASELPLWQALERDLLCPFHYFGVADGTDLSGIEWRRGGYELSGLDNLYTGNDARARLVIGEARDKVSDITRMRALGFCVSVAHARYMARVFNNAGIPAESVDASTNTEVREAALRRLRQREINIVFAVDLFNEGVDLPELDTVLLLRPTESATVFLQQLGRGLRRAPGKDCLTVLDFIGQQHRRFRFDTRYLALSGATRAALPDQIEAGFPFLPAGSHIHLDRVAQRTVLDNVRSQIQINRRQLTMDVRSVGTPSLVEYLRQSERSLTDIYRARSSWTEIKRAAGLPTTGAGPDEEALLRRVASFSHVDDPERTAFLRETLTSTTPPEHDLLPLRRQRLLTMLFFSLWPNAGEFTSYEAGLRRLWEHPAVREEIVELLDVTEANAEFTPRRLSEHFADVPLSVHCRYSREEILAAVGYASLDRKPRADMAGVRWVPDLQTDVFTVTLQKTERQYSPTTLYKDYAISADLFHWESQNATSQNSPVGRRYLAQRRTGTHVLLFARETQKAETGGAGAYLLLGECDYVSHKGERPIAITWHLRQPMPAAFYARAALLAG